MTKEQMLEIIKLISAMESASLVNGVRFPAYLYDKLVECTEILTKEVLK